MVVAGQNPKFFKLMKRIPVLLALILSCYTASFAQTYDFKTFEPLMEGPDTAAIRKMLDEWEPHNADYYAALFNYSIIVAEDGEDASQTFDVMDEGVSAFPDRLDLRFARIYTRMKLEDYPAVLSGLDDVLSRNDEIGGEWLWTDDEPVEDTRNSILSAIDDYLSQMRESGQQEAVDTWIDGAAGAYPFFKNGFLIIRERWLAEEWRQDESIDILRSILADDPEYRAALYDLAYLSYLRNDYDTAAELFGKLRDLSDDETEIADFEGYINICLTEQAQEYFPPDLKEIERFVKKDRKGYDALVERFAAADTTLTDEEIRKVYYGYAFTESYSPYADYTTMVNALMKEGKEDEAWSVADGLLEKNPVSLWLLRELFLMTEGEEADGYQRRYSRLMDGILSTGNGRSMDRAIHVIIVDDEYEILNEVFGMQSLNGQALVGDSGSAYDRMEFMNSYGDAVTLYFNVDLLFRKYDEIFK